MGVGQAAAKLRKIRGKRTLYAFAHEAGIGWQQVANLEAGITHPLALRLATALALLETYPELSLADLGYEGPLRLQRR